MSRVIQRRLACLMIGLSVSIASCSKNLSTDSDEKKNLEEKSSSTLDSVNTVLLSPDELNLLRQKGEYLAAIAACGSCHSGTGRANSPLSGGRKLKDDIGEIIIPNITSDNETGIGSWSIGDLKRSIRDNIGKDQRLLSPLAHSSYRWISDEDALALAVYLSKTEPRKNKIEYRKTTKFQNKKWGILSQHSEVVGYVPNLPEKSGGYRGMYLTNFVQNCARCHSPKEEMADKPKFFDGYEGSLYFQEDDEVRQVPSIRDNEKGLKNKSETFILEHLSKERTGSSLCPTDFYSSLTEIDKKAIAVYLKSLK